MEDDFNSETSAEYSLKHIMDYFQLLTNKIVISIYIHMLMAVPSTQPIRTVNMFWTVELYMVKKQTIGSFNK